jgi:hypothetical protein
MKKKQKAKKGKSEQSQMGLEKREERAVKIDLQRILKIAKDDRRKIMANDPSGKDFQRILKKARQTAKDDLRAMFDRGDWGAAEAFKECEKMAKEIQKLDAESAFLNAESAFLKHLIVQITDVCKERSG